MADKLTTYDQLEELAKRGSGELAEVATATTEAIKELSDKIVSTVGAYTWHMDTDKVYDKDGKDIGSLKSCMTADMTGTWFFARTSTTSAGSAQYPSSYTINGANGYLSLGDFVIWTGEGLVHVSTYEAKSSTVKNGDGRYSPHSGVDGLMSSTDKAYLTDLIDQHWGRGYLPVYTTPEPAEGWQTNWLFDDGWYLGGIKKDCGGHPPVLKDNHTSWAVLVLNRMATDADSLNHNHRLQIAWDLVNSKVYMRRGWMNANTWADKWDEVGADQINQFGVDPQTGAWPNWLNDIGIYKIQSWASGAGNLPPTATDSDPADLWIVVTTAGAKDATAATARTQYAIRTDNRAVYTRSNPGYSGTGSLTASGSMSAWTTVMDGVQTHTHDNKAALDTITQAKITSWDGAQLANCKVVMSDMIKKVEIDDINGVLIFHLTDDNWSSGNPALLRIYNPTGSGYTLDSDRLSTILSGNFTVTANNLQKTVTVKPVKDCFMYIYYANSSVQASSTTINGRLIMTLRSSGMAIDSFDTHLFADEFVNIGKLSDLQTTDKTSIVAAINELVKKLGGG